MMIEDNNGSCKCHGLVLFGFNGTVVVGVVGAKRFRVDS